VALAFFTMEVPVNVLTTATGLVLYLVLSSMPAIAAPMLDTLPTLNSLSNRLELTSEQENTLAPLFEKRIAELRETKTRLEQASSDQQKRDVMREARHAGDAFNQQVEKVLTPSQQHEWREIRKELREKAKERAEEKAEQDR
jgi:hypothetical protein